MHVNEVRSGFHDDEIPSFRLSDSDQDLQLQTDEDDEIQPHSNVSLLGRKVWE